ncbi:MAG TPA: hypothetical protein VGH76_25185 [Actinomycetospora sp.]|uniref:hypothetical protein n=1 Tax=Actinomycetospora sp. TaxID=1872135 RepID=UPI002F3E4EC7
MTWFKVDDQLPDHRKFRALGARNRMAATGLWTTCGAWAANAGTDGFVPVEIVRRYDPRLRLAAALVDAKLWVEDKVDGEDGFCFHDWSVYQPTKESQTVERSYNAWKTALYRDREVLDAVGLRDSNRCRRCGVKVDFRDRRSSSGGCYADVEASGAVTVDNVVTFCKGCRDLLGGRSVQVAGMTLLRPGSLGTGVVSGSYLDTDQATHLETLLAPRPGPSRPGGGGAPARPRAPTREAKPPPPTPIGTTKDTPANDAPCGTHPDDNRPCHRCKDIRLATPKTPPPFWK